MNLTKIFNSIHEFPSHTSYLNAALAVGVPVDEIVHTVSFPSVAAAIAENNRI